MFQESLKKIEPNQRKTQNQSKKGKVAKVKLSSPNWVKNGQIVDKAANMATLNAFIWSENFPFDRQVKSSQVMHKHCVYVRKHLQAWPNWGWYSFSIETNGMLRH